MTVTNQACNTPNEDPLTHFTCGLYYKHIMIANEDSLCDTHHLLAMTESSFTIVMFMVQAIGCHRYLWLILFGKVLLFSNLAKPTSKNFLKF